MEFQQKKGDSNYHLYRIFSLRKENLIQKKRKKKNKKTNLEYQTKRIQAKRVFSLHTNATEKQLLILNVRRNETDLVVKCFQRKVQTKKMRKKKNEKETTEKANKQTK